MDFNTQISKRIDELNAVCRVVFPENSYKQFKEHYDECENSIRNGNAEFVENRKYTYTTYDVFYETTSRYYKHIDPESRRGLVGVYSWIQTKTLYAFDPELIVNFNKMSWDDLKDYPVDIFNQLPMDCFAIMMNEDCVIDGLIFDTMIIINDRKHVINLESTYGPIHKSSGIQVIFSKAGNKDAPVGFFGFSNIEPTPGFDMNFEQLYEANLDAFVPDETRDSFKKKLEFLLPYILYIISKNAEISQPVENKKVYKPFKFEPKHRYREVKTLVCGKEYGNKIRAFKKLQSDRGTSGVGSVRAPHIRRAHYHRYWVGSGDDRHVVIKWVEATYIHKDMIDIMQSTGVKL